MSLVGDNFNKGKIMDFREFYNIFKVVHIVSIISWFAMLFYLPRLFVYHSMEKKNEGFRNIVEVQEHKLYYYIGYPAMILTIISGVFLILSIPGIMSSGGWLHAKLLLVLFLVIYHFLCGYYMKQFKIDNFKNHNFFRFFNEVPTILLIVIVVLVVIRPF